MLTLSYVRACLCPHACRLMRVQAPVWEMVPVSDVSNHLQTKLAIF